MATIDTKCAGRSNCEFEVEELEINNENCVKALMKYLEVDFVCMKGDQNINLHAIFKVIIIIMNPYV